MWTRTNAVDGPAGPRRVIAIDGKTVRGAGDPRLGLLHFAVQEEQARALREAIEED